jgi:hypothetical protein
MADHNGGHAQLALTLTAVAKHVSRPLCHQPSRRGRARVTLRRAAVHATAPVTFSVDR